MRKVQKRLCGGKVNSSSHGRSSFFDLVFILHCYYQSPDLRHIFRAYFKWHKWALASGVVQHGQNGDLLVLNLAYLADKLILLMRFRFSRDNAYYAYFTRKNDKKLQNL